MKNVNRQSGYSNTWTRVLKSNNTKTSSTNSGNANVEIVTSSTNTVMNQGDHFRDTPFSYTVSRSTPLSFNCFAYNAIYQETVSGTNTNVVLSRDTGSEQWGVSKANNDAVDGLNSYMRGDVDLSVDLAESSKTWEMLTGSVTRLRRYAKNVLSGDRGTSKALANVWLEAKYGWIPLLSTMHDLVNPSHPDGGSKIHIVKGNGYARTHISKPDQRTLWGHRILGTRTITSEVKVKFKAGLRMDALNAAHYASRYSSLNPLSIGWELLPYSFVVDWVYDIGGFLRSNETALLYNHVVDWVGKSTLFVVHDNGYGNKLDTPGYSGFGTYSFSNEYISFSRTRQGALPTSTPYFKSVDEIGYNKFLTAAALLRQVFR